MAITDELVYPDELSKAKLHALTKRVNERYDEIPNLTRDRTSVHGLYQIGNTVEIQEIEIDALKK